MDPIWTIAVCTRNRAGMLARCLGAIKALRVPPGLEFELLVVLSACQDDSRAVAEAAGLDHCLRVVELAEPGIARARNAAIENATASYLAYLDDDVVAPPDYLGKLERARGQDPDCDAFAGPIMPGFLDSPPTWVLEAGQFDVSRREHGEYLPDAPFMRGFLVDYHLPGPSRRYTWGLLRPFSANMAFKLDAIRAIGPGPFASGGPFVPEMGKGGAWEIMGEDTEIWMRLEQLHRPRRYIHDLLVEHLHEAARLTPARLFRWAWERGATLTFLRYAYPPFLGVIPGFDMLAARITAGPSGALPLGPLDELIARAAAEVGPDPSWEQIEPHVTAFERHGRHAGLTLIGRLTEMPLTGAE
ncbi:MAG: glycosyltransferase family 2 protein [Planctomycetota bacterium]